LESRSLAARVERVLNARVREPEDNWLRAQSRTALLVQKGADVLQPLRQQRHRVGVEPSLRIAGHLHVPAVTGQLPDAAQLIRVHRPSAGEAVDVLQASVVRRRSLGSQILLDRRSVGAQHLLGSQRIEETQTPCMTSRVAGGAPCTHDSSRMRPIREPEPMCETTWYTSQSVQYDCSTHPAASSAPR